MKNARGLLVPLIGCERFERGLDSLEELPLRRTGLVEFFGWSDAWGYRCGRCRKRAAEADRVEDGDDVVRGRKVGLPVSGER